MGKYRAHDPPPRGAYLQLIRDSKKAERQHHRQRGKGKRTKKLPPLGSFLKHISLFQVLGTPQIYPKKIRTRIAELLGRNHVKILHNVVHDIYKGKIPIQGQHAKDLFPHNETLRKFVDSPNYEEKKKFLVKQKGGFIFSVLLPVLTSLLSAGVGEGIHALANRKKHH